MLIPFALAWVFHWLPHERKWAAALSEEANRAIRIFQWAFWIVWLGLAATAIALGLSELFQ